MKINLVFDDWQKEGKSIYETEEGVQLTFGFFHSGTTFSGEIHFDNPEEEKEFKEALDKGYQPVFWVDKDNQHEN